MSEVYEKQLGHMRKLAESPWPLTRVEGKALGAVLARYDEMAAEIEDARRELAIMQPKMDRIVEKFQRMNGELAALRAGKS